ncbi:hypothetical protein Tco_0514609 [Tanacetum coccineum]
MAKLLKAHMVLFCTSFLILLAFHECWKNEISDMKTDAIPLEVPPSCAKQTGKLLWCCCGDVKSCKSNPMECDEYCAKVKKSCRD